MAATPTTLTPTPIPACAAVDNPPDSLDGLGVVDGVLLVAVGFVVDVAEADSSADEVLKGALVMLKKEEDIDGADWLPCTEAFPSNNQRKKTLEFFRSKL